MTDSTKDDHLENFNLREELLRYFSFWPYILVSITIFLISALIYLRYANYEYQISAKIEIIDKAQDSEMSLPTAMTIFNRSMINLENEIGVLSSFNIHGKVFAKINHNVQFYTDGIIKSSRDHHSEWFDDYIFELKLNSNQIESYSVFEFRFYDNYMNIIETDINGNILKQKDFNEYSTFNTNHDFPFNFSVSDYDFNNDDLKKIIFIPHDLAVDIARNRIIISVVGKESDQLNINLMSANPKIGIDYINNLLNEFDKDGIFDRQLEYKRTIDFVDSRSDFLRGELEQIEIRKQNFKRKNNLTNIVSDAELNINQQLNYNSELFEARSQMDLVKLLKEVLNENINYQLLPVNIGLRDQNLNSLISEYNVLVKERERYLFIGAGAQNSLVKNLENQISNYSENIIFSVENYIESLSLNIENIERKEMEYADIYLNIPENEKILRGIERELEIKEALFLLLLQKREEAAINFAVVKPSIKVIDSARSSLTAVSPQKEIVLIGSLLIGILIPIMFLYIWFLLDNKIHTRKQLKSLLGEEIPVIAEIPYFSKDDIITSFNDDSTRDQISESIRMLISNLEFSFLNLNKDKNKISLITSSIKGEGKTVISVFVSKLLSKKNLKVLLIGADLRNPQIHKYFDIEKSTKGLTDILYNDDMRNYEKYIIKRDNLHSLLSGTIPPNPTEILSSEKFKSLLNHLSGIYDHIIIDSAPCLLVSDSFELSNYVDNTIYVMRANYTEEKICDYIKENFENEKIKNLNIVFNGVGSSQGYGYKYGYQYGYKYGYKYGYNYGYGYGYLTDND
tara:strand:+ start:4649 stop:7039 length:2391 start_codon:yes stop_codon:yes gene_type:complete